MTDYLPMKPASTETNLEVLCTYSVVSLCNSLYKVESNGAFLQMQELSSMKHKIFGILLPTAVPDIQSSGH